jgi:hypothetical protein
MKMTSNEKTLNYKVVDLAVSYKVYFHPSSNKKIQIFEKRLNP